VFFRAEAESRYSACGKNTPQDVVARKTHKLITGAKISSEAAAPALSDFGRHTPKTAWLRRFRGVLSFCQAVTKFQYHVFISFLEHYILCYWLKKGLHFSHR
jgi:hypothetical protein